MANKKRQLSYDEKKTLVAAALGIDRWNFEDFYDDSAVYQQRIPDPVYGGTKATGTLLKVSYSIDDSNKVTVGTPEKVASHKVYDRIQETILIESSQIQEDGTIKDCVLIAPGESKNRTDYSPSMLSTHAHLFEGLAAYSGHKVLPGGQVDVAAKSDPRNLAGRWSNARYVESKGIVADLTPLESGASTIKTAKEAGDLCGISIDMAADFKIVRKGRKAVREAVSFKPSEFNSADIVVNPAAGGRLGESVTDPWWTQYDQETNPMKYKIEQIRANATAWRVVESVVPEEERQGLTVDVLSEKYPDTAKAIEAIMEAGAAAEPAKPATPAAEPTQNGRSQESTQPDTTVTEATQILEEIKLERHRTAVEKRLSESKLPQEFVDIAMQQYGDRVCEMAQVDAFIQQTKKALDVATGSGRVRENGVQVGAEQIDKMKKAVEGMLLGQDVDNIPAFRNMRHAYGTFVGASYGDVIDPRVILRETRGRDGFDSELRATETLQSTSWAQVFGDAMHKRMIAEFQLSDEQEWRQIVSTISNVADFRTQHLVKYGGFGTLPSVVQGGTYQPLADPGDDEETYTVSKYGAIYDITFEAIQNDDMRVIRSIPIRMGRAARVTLNRFAFNLITSNPNMGDGVALFHTNSNLRGGDGATAASGNLATTAFSSAQLEVRRINMVKRASYGQTVSSTKMDVGSIRPKNIFVPPDLEKSAWKEVNSLVETTGGTAGQNNSTEPNFNKSQNYNVIVVPFWTDSNNWYLSADPRTCPTLEIGFLNGRQEPEMFTKDEFEVDKITYKIRHIYGGIVEEPLAWDASVVSGS